MTRFPRSFLVASLVLAACSESPGDPGTDSDASTWDAEVPRDDGGHDAGSDAGPTLGPECTTTIDASASMPRWVRLCALDGVPRHVRVEGVTAPATHASAQLFFGFDAQPAGSQAPLAADQLKVMLYGGGSPAPEAQLDVVFGSTSLSPSGEDTFVNTPSTLCFDLHDGSASTPPYFVLWRDGVRGASCGDRSTLTIASAYAIEVDFDGAVGALAKERGTYYYQSAGIATAPTITLSTEPAVEEPEAAASGACETTWQSNVDYQPLCVPAAGRARHYLIRSASAPSPNKYFYVVAGLEGTPSGNPSTADGDGRFVFTGGQSNSTASWSFFRFDGSATTQFSYAAGEPALPLFTTAPSTVCLDLGATDEGNLHVRFWASGASGADCETRTSLSEANALYDSAASGDAFWDAPLSALGSDYVKISGSDPIGGAVLTTIRSVSTPAIR